MTQKLRSINWAPAYTGTAYTSITLYAHPLCFERTQNYIEASKAQIW